MSPQEVSDQMLEVLHAGYIRRDTSTVASTISLIVDEPQVVIVDPGMVADVDSALLRPLAERNISPDGVTDVVLSHHHPDHTVNCGHFSRARVHDHWATYEADRWTSRPAEGFEVSANVRLIHTPGHTREDVTTLVSTVDGTAALTHLWWDASGPEEDPVAVDADTLHAGRARVLEIASLIVPGHGAPFTPSPRTPE